MIVGMMSDRVAEPRTSQADVVCWDREAHARSLLAALLVFTSVTHVLERSETSSYEWLSQGVLVAFFFYMTFIAPRRKLGRQVLSFTEEMVKIGDVDSFTYHELISWRATRSGQLRMRVRGANIVFKPDAGSLTALTVLVATFAARPQRPGFRVLPVGAVSLLIGGAMIVGGGVALRSEHMIGAGGLAMVFALVLGWLHRREGRTPPGS